MIWILTAAVAILWGMVSIEIWEARRTRRRVARVERAAFGQEDTPPYLVLSPLDVRAYREAEDDRRIGWQEAREAEKERPHD